MSIDEIEAIALELPEEERAELIDRLQDSLVDDEIDPADLAESRRILEEIRSGRMRTVPAEEVLDMLDRMAL